MATLSGLHIVNTRAVEQAQELSSLLSAQGADVIEFPMLSFSTVEKELICEQIKTISSGDYLVFTSANGVRFFCDSLPDRAILEGASIATIGEKTASAAKTYGLEVNFIAQNSNSEEMAKELLNVFEQHNLTADRKPNIFLLRNDIANPQLPEILQKSGNKVVDIVVYKTVVPAIKSEDLKECILSADLIIFTSSQAVKNLTAAINKQSTSLKNHLLRIPIATIGPKTRETVKQCGLNLVVSSSKQTIEALVEEISIWAQAVIS